MENKTLIGSVVGFYNSVSLIIRIIIGIAVGTVLGLVFPGASWLAVFGDLFVGALKAIAPVSPLHSQKARRNSTKDSESSSSFM